MGVKEGERRSLGYRLANAIVHGLSKTIRLLDGSAKEHKGCDAFLSGPWEPVSSEVHAAALEVIEGQLPADLAGAYLRTGPNPKLAVEGNYHLFDGDGMVHAVRIKGGKASYCNRWVKTARLAQEEKAGWPLVTKIGDYRGWAFFGYLLRTNLAKALGLLSTKEGLGTANTALAYHAGRLLALHEGDLPYALRIACNGLVETVSRATFEGKISHPFTAHPKADAATGELFYFGYNIQQQPHCYYGWLDASGKVVRDFPVPLKEPVMMHDMALTQNYVLLLDMPLVFDPKIMIKEGKLPFVYKNRPARIGVLPRHAESADEIRWFETERFMCFHAAAAWEEGSKIRLYLCTMKDFSLDLEGTSEEGQPYMSEVVLDLQDGSTAYRCLPGAVPGDFPVVPAHLMGRPVRYTYAASVGPTDSGVPHFTGITKYDLQVGGGSAVAGQIQHGAGRIGGEAYFVPRAGTSEQDGEDAGYLLTIVTDMAKQESELVLYDAATMSSSPVARVRLPQRVPSGFHCTWVTEEQLAAQDSRP